MRTLVLGAAGMLGSKLLARVPARIEASGADRADFDIADEDSVRALVRDRAPELIFNCAARTDVDALESDRAGAFAVDGDGPGHVARAAREVGAAAVHLSTDYVFDGEKAAPYLETDPPNPLGVYGAAKLAGERAFDAAGLPRGWVVRTSWLYGAGGTHFPRTIARLARDRRELAVVHDQRGAPTWTSDLADALWRLVGATGAPAVAPGTYHVASQGECSWYDLALRVVAALRERGVRLAVAEVRPVATSEFPRPAPRPRRSTLDCGKYQRATGTKLPRWEDALERYLAGEGRVDLGGEAPSQADRWSPTADI